MAKKVNDNINKTIINNRRKSKKTSIGASRNSRPLNKSKRRSFKRYNRQGK